MKIRRGERHTQIAETILKAADAGEFLTQIEVWERLPYKCAYGTLRKMIDTLEDRKMVMRERSGRFVVIKPMLLLYQWYRR